jgi:hypothetical protein
MTDQTPAGTGPPDRFAVHRKTWRAVALAAGAGLLLGSVLSWIGGIVNQGPPAALTVALPTACCALLVFVYSTFHVMRPLELRPAGPTQRNAEYAVRLRQLERRLQAATTDGTKFDWSLRPLLAQLAAERLRHKHAITIRREPERARAMLGEQLWQMISTQPAEPSPALSRQQLTALIEAIEAL